MESRNLFKGNDIEAEEGEKEITSDGGAMHDDRCVRKCRENDENVVNDNDTSSRRSEADQMAFLVVSSLEGRKGSRGILWVLVPLRINICFVLTWDEVLTVAVKFRFFISLVSGLLHHHRQSSDEWKEKFPVLQNSSEKCR